MKIPVAILFGYETFRSFHFALLHVIAPNFFGDVGTDNSGVLTAIEAISKGLNSPSFRDRERAATKFEKVSPVTAQVEEALWQAL